MRPPRYRFPEEVRSTTRYIAAEMVRDGTIAETPEQLDAWVSGRPDVLESLERGGYNTAFTADDLFPLLQVFIVQAGGPGPAAEAPPRTANNRWLIVAVVVLLVAVFLFVVATQAQPTLP